MKVLVGLGNVGNKYEGTRHNLGFSVVNYFLSKIRDFEFSKTSLSELYIKNEIIVCKPTTYMNLSGDALISIKNEYELNNSDFLIVYDDLNLPIGSFKYSFNRGHGGHNGIKDILQKIGGSDFVTLRVGIGPRERAYCISEYVLDFFSDEEKEKISGILPILFESINYFLKGYSVSWLQNRFNV